jgi:peptidoglycan hydrolase-like protein with peptidoglycan-binding domain
MPTLSGSVVPRSSLTALPYPGHVIKRDEKNKDIVRAIQHRLNETGCGPIDEDGGFGKHTEDAVKLFQTRFSDQDGQPLKVDGEVGSITWTMLFGSQTVPVVIAPEPHTLLAKALEVAISQIGVREKPLGSNRGPQVDKYLKSVGLNPASGHFAWCAAFVYWCYDQAATALGRANPVIKTAGVLDHWARAAQKGINRITTTAAKNNPSLVKPGHIFIIDHGGTTGHTGMVERVSGGKLVTIEGNTNDGGSREGIGVFRREARKIADINKGFINYSDK